jgi:hypothetical protein
MIVLFAVITVPDLDSHAPFPFHGPAHDHHDPRGRGC